MIQPETGITVRKASDLTYPAAVVLDLDSFSINGEFICARQLDDLAGCAAILAALVTVKNDASTHRPIVGLFTRAEEVGLVGAALAAADEVVGKDAIIVSVETSLKSDNAKQGDGVVIRVGDRMTTFDHNAEAVLHAAAHRIWEHGPADGFKVQRALMGRAVVKPAPSKRTAIASQELRFPSERGITLKMMDQSSRNTSISTTSIRALR